MMRRLVPRSCWGVITMTALGLQIGPQLGPSSARADLIVTTGMQPWETCASCHSLDGISAMARFPKLAGQRADYIAKQVRDFRDGRRQNDGGQMAAIAGDIDDENLAKSAAYFAGLPAPPPDASQPTDSEDWRRGAALYRDGDGTAGIAGCSSCHEADRRAARRAAAEGPARRLSRKAVARLALGRAAERRKPDHAGDRRKAHRPRHRRARCVSRLAAAQPVECRAGAINCFSERHREPTQHAGCWKRSETLSCRSVASHGDGSSDRFLGTMFGGYRPELHYMRGSGPKSRAQHSHPATGSRQG